MSIGNDPRAQKRFKRQVLGILQEAHTEPDNGWMDQMDVLRTLGHGTPGEVARAVMQLEAAGLAEYDTAKGFRSRGVTASHYRPYPPEETTQPVIDEFVRRAREDQVACADDIWFISTALTAQGYTPMHAVSELIKRGWTPPAEGAR
ncbi:hypothetical protein SEA_KHARCHO_19 [Arthrobacter phage Kharcho]|nr:hypothetical protein SEA_KHARCHO_19 [Arthrobacter phage Kharcho]